MRSLAKSKKQIDRTIVILEHFLLFLDMAYFLSHETRAKEFIIHINQGPKGTTCVVIYDLHRWIPKKAFCPELKKLTHDYLYFRRKFTTHSLLVNNKKTD
jgi:hypothetical protein